MAATGIVSPFLMMLAGTGIAIAAVLLAGRRRTDKAKQKAARPAPGQQEPADPEKLDALAAYIDGKTAQPVYRVRPVNAPCDLAASKFGGYPLWPRGMDYPTSADGEKLVLLAQLNFSKDGPFDAPLPQEGILQFFVLDDDIFGLDLSPSDKKEGFRVVYHKAVTDPLTAGEMQERGIPSTTCLNATSSFPVNGEYALDFTKDTDYLSPSVFNYNDLLAEAIQTLCGEDGTDAVRQLSGADMSYLWDKRSTFGHKLLGYPGFTQEDPREPGTPYDTLLLQIDSEDGILWGDSGVANFFINENALRALDFTGVLYTWDCY